MKLNQKHTSSNFQTFRNYLAGFMPSYCGFLLQAKRLAKLVAEVAEVSKNNIKASSLQHLDI